MKTRKIKVIGAGGIGSWLLPPLAKYLSFCGDSCDLTVIDGDKFEDRNRTRQQFKEIGFKAEQTVNTLKADCPKIHFRHKNEYLDDRNIIVNIREDDVVFLCVDNHATRKLVSDRCEELENIVLINGGNDYTDGNVMWFIKKNGAVQAPTIPLTKMDTRIGNPQDKNPGSLNNEERQGCQREAEANPQLLFTNFAAASHMLNVYRRITEGKCDHNNLFFDIDSLKTRPTPEL